ncbi:biotin-independent malonate decarboxylase subunit gamma [Actinoplanes subtropicus]|uniref:biotin-independent malonate decarboxylase subunit gamma n=1 Tax=Actinoplanes subtropicus TaxID=543632 RepID=UPI0004C2FD9F|nr:biotin-independent malonate decarboxylase subunit gamma [Actinoplanes subtropicus]
MTAQVSTGSVWFDVLADTTGDAGGVPIPRSLRVGACHLDDEPALLAAVVPDPDARFPRARTGEVGIDEGWAIAQMIRRIIRQDHGRPRPRAIVVVVDVPGQAYGYVEELAGLHQSLAASVHAVASARSFGHPVVALVAGKAMSGGFLAIGLQANRIVLLDHDGVAIQVMSKPSAARITHRSLEELDATARIVPATAYDAASFASLGAVHSTVVVCRPARPDPGDIARVRSALSEAVHAARQGPSDLRCRLESPQARTNRALSIQVRDLVADAWNA